MSLQVDTDFVYLYTNKNTILVGWASVYKILINFLCNGDNIKEKTIKAIAQNINLENQSESK